jgi:hypothetical protein
VVVRAITNASVSAFILASCGSTGGPATSQTAPVPVTSTADSDPTDRTSAGQHADDETADVTDDDAADGAEQRFPDVIDATAERTGDTWTIAATLSSPYDTPERFADAWRVIGPDSTVFGERILTHDHANEQPFTRSQSGIEIPDGVTLVTIEGRDLENGWGGETFALDLVG